MAINGTKNKLVKQAAILYASTVLGVLVSLGITILNTRLLGPVNYGNFKYLQSLFSFVAPFLSIGLYISGGRLLTLKRHENEKHELIGKLLKYAGIVSICFIGIILITSFLGEVTLENKLGNTIRLILPIVFFVPFIRCLENILQGDNRIYELSLFRIGPKFLYLILVSIIATTFSLPLTVALLIHYSCIAFFVLIIVYWLKPDFSDKNRFGAIIWKENRRYGFQVYAGRLANVATVHLGALSVGYFIDSTNVGYYSLAVAVTMPLAMIPSVIGTTLFKEFANRKSISRKVIAITFATSIFTLLVFLIILEDLVLLFYSSEYLSIVPLAYLLALASMLRGWGDFFNKFLGSHGRGKDLRNSAFANGITNVLGYTFLVYAFGVEGAVYTKIISDITYLLMVVYYYRIQVISLMKSIKGM